MSQWFSLRRLFASAAGLLVGIKPSEGLSLFRAERNSIDRLSAFTFTIKCHIISATCGSSSQGLSKQDLCSPWPTAGKKHPPLTVFVVMETNFVYGNNDTTIDFVKNLCIFFSSGCSDKTPCSLVLCCWEVWSESGKFSVYSCHLKKCTHFIAYIKTICLIRAPNCW